MAAPDDVAISIVGLTKKFGKQTIWEYVTFDIPKGQISVILGPSGTGKSVLLKHVLHRRRRDRDQAHAAARPARGAAASARPCVVGRAARGDRQPRGRPR